MTLTKRSDKGSALTYEEMDENFTHLGGDGTYQMPSTDGVNGQVLQTNGEGQVSFITQGESFTTGMILLWSGAIANIPNGWSLCDGTNGTPNLTDRFVVGAGNSYAVDATGGSADAVVVSHTHSFSGTTDGAGSHSHTVTTFGSLFDRGVSGDGTNLCINSTSRSTSTVGDHTHSFSGTTASAGESGTNKNLPPYYALAYIMKL